MRVELIKYQHKTLGYVHTDIVCSQCKFDSTASNPLSICEVLSSHELALFDICDMAFVTISPSGNDNIKTTFEGGIVDELYRCDFDLIEDMFKCKSSFSEMNSIAEEFWNSITKIDDVDNLDESIYMIPKRYLKTKK